MKFLKRKKNKAHNIKYSQEFNFAMDFITNSLEEQTCNKNKIIILDFMINAVKNDLKTDLLSKIIYSKKFFEKEFRYPFPLFYFDKDGNEFLITEKESIKINLANSCILVLPWHTKRLCDQILNIYHNDFIYLEHNHKGYYFPYIDLCYIYNGTHSISSGIIHNKGTIKVIQYDITELFPHIYTDGQSWYNIHNDEKIGEVVDFRVAIIYEIAKIKYKIEGC